MTLVTEEISQAIKTLSLKDSEFKRLPDSEAKTLYYELLETFVEGNDRRWWWEAFKDKTESIIFEDNKGFERILSFVPNPKEKVWFVAEEDQLSFYPIYEATPENIVKVIGECFAFEYYVIPKSKEWLLCENHHNTVIGSGDIIVKNMQSKSA